MEIKEDLIIKSPKRTNDVRIMFSKIAPRYDFMNHIMSLGRDLSWRRLAVKNAKFNRGSRILDLGIGTGDMAREVIRQVVDVQIVGLDNCLDLMNYSDHKSELHNPRKPVLWLLANGQRLPFSNKSFDGIVAAFSIRNMSNLSLVFSEIDRILLPGGKIVILDMVQPDHHFFKIIFKLYFRHIIPPIGKLLGSDPDAYSYLLPSIENFFSSNQLRKVLQNLGYSEIFSKDLILKTVTIYIGIK